MEIVIKNLSKKYSGKNALEQVNLHMEEGIYGLLGANGAGKTTLLRILATLLVKSSGSVTIDGISIEDVKAVRSLIGYMPQEFGFYPGFSVYEILDYFSSLSNIRTGREENIDMLLEAVNLQEARKMRVRSLSGGMKRRLGIAVALINQPKLLLVDEPTVGLDPEERMRFRNLLSRYAKGRTILLSTHIISDIEDICSNLAVLKKGKILYSGSSQEFRLRSAGRVWQWEILEQQYKTIQQELENTVTVISRIAEGDIIKLRILSDEKPGEEAYKIAPGIEDSYIDIIGENSKEQFAIH